jgi:biopolymer transport protein ExbD
MAISYAQDDSDEPTVMVEMNTTPLIDVMLVLLVMLIISIPIQLHAVSIEMPAASSTPPTLEPVIVKLEISAASQVLWNGVLMPDSDALQTKLKEAAGMADQPEIHIRPDRAAKYDTVAQVMALAQRTGLVKIGVVGAEQFAR